MGEAETDSIVYFKYLTMTKKSTPKGQIKTCKKCHSMMSKGGCIRCKLGNTHEYLTEAEIGKGQEGKKVHGLEGCEICKPKQEGKKCKCSCHYGLAITCKVCIDNQCPRTPTPPREEGEKLGCEDCLSTPCQCEEIKDWKTLPKIQCEECDKEHTPPREEFYENGISKLLKKAEVAQEVNNKLLNQAIDNQVNSMFPREEFGEIIESLIMSRSLMSFSPFTANDEAWWRNTLLSALRSVRQQTAKELYWLLHDKNKGSWLRILNQFK